MTERSGERFDRIRVDTFRKKITHDSGENGWQRGRSCTASSGKVQNRKICDGA